MDTETAIREIDEAVHNHVGGTDGGFRDACEAALEEVERVGGGDGVDENRRFSSANRNSPSSGDVDDLARFVNSHVREHEERPDIVAVDARAAEIIRDHGGELPADSSLHSV